MSLELENVIDFWMTANKRVSIHIVTNLFMRIEEAVVVLDVNYFPRSLSGCFAISGVVLRSSANGTLTFFAVVSDPSNAVYTIRFIVWTLCACLDIAKEAFSI